MFAVLLLSVLTSLALIPFSWHETMVIEEKYGFNRTSPKTFILDSLKEFLLQLGLLTGIGSALLGLHKRFGDWLILVFAGFGRMKTIVLYDTLLERMTDDEICAVFAHEMGHGLHKDTLKNQLTSFVQMLIIGLLAWLTLRTPALFTAFGFEKVNYGFALILIMSVEFALFMPLFGFLANALSRRAEYRADAHAAKEGYADALISGLKKLSRENFSDIAPSRTLVTLTYSHPTLAQRIEALQKGDKED